MSESWVLTTAFCAAHIYHQKQWTEAQNRAVFGKCFDPYGHGHNYRLEVTLTPTDHRPREALERLLQREVEVLDHHHLNYLPEFQNMIPTTENIALYFLKKLQAAFANEKISSIKLYESTNIWVELQA